jgi:hypothetical protein
MAGSGEFFSSGFQRVAGSTIVIDHCALGSLSWTAAPLSGVTIKNISVTSGALPVPANSDVNSTAQGNPPATELFTDPWATIPNFTPLSPLQAPDGSWYGALKPTGEYQAMAA